MAEMGVDILRNNLTNPARTYLWDLIIPNPIGGGNSNLLMVRARTAVLPGRSVGTIKVPYKQTAGIKYAGKLAYPQAIQFTFMEGEDRKVFDAIHAWNQKIIHDVAGYGDGDDLIKTDINMVLISTKNETYMRIKLVGCYVQEIGDVALSYDDESIIQYPVTFSYDRWEHIS